MKRYLVLVGLLGGCGDNSKLCGPGTIDKAGTCTPDACGPGTKDDGTGHCVPDGSVVCVNGTKFDALTGHCVIDPAACQDGTVLVNGACVDAGHVMVDLEEGPEPNGRGLFGETSVAPAGTIVPKPIGGPGFVIHGHISPFQDLNNDNQDDPDVDSYEITVTAPTLLHITADGLHGLAAGFVSVAEVGNTDPLFRWSRLGIGFEGDMSKRQLLLPRAGTYIIGISDVRTLLLRAAAGSAVAEYYVTIDALALPAPTPITLSPGIVGSVAEELHFYSPGQLSTTMATNVFLDMPLSEAKASIVVLNQGTLLTFADETTSRAHAVVSGIATGDSTVIVVDFVYNYALEPADFSLSGS